MTTTVEHGFNLDAVRRELDREDWQDDPENPGTQVRRLYLGDVFSLTPSGKMYAPFATGNLDRCHTCKGTGIVLPRRLKRRVEKRQAARHARLKRAFIRRFGGEGWAPHEDGPQRDAALAWIKAHPAYRSVFYSNGSTCTACAGCCSREAHLDQLWHEAAEEGIAKTPKGDEGDGVFMSWEDGNAFAVEMRDASDDECPECSGTGCPECEDDDEGGEVDTEATEGDAGF